MRIYERLVLDFPKTVLAFFFLILLTIGWQGRNFTIDSSADGLFLEGDQDLKYYHQIIRRYGKDDVLILAVSPRQDGVLSPANLDELQKLQDRLTSITGIANALSVVNSPLFNSPHRELRQVVDGLVYLGDPEVDIDLVEEELLTSPLYREFMLSTDTKTTLLLLEIESDHEYDDLIFRRDDLKEIKKEGKLTTQQSQELRDVEARAEAKKIVFNEANARMIREIRELIKQYMPIFSIHLGGVRMIANDMLRMVRADMVTFGGIVFAFMVFFLAIIFRSVAWTAIPLICCISSVMAMVGLMGWVGWHGTVVSANFIALMVIMTLSMCIHILVRFRQQQTIFPQSDKKPLLRSVIRYMFKPCLYTVLTTQAAFLSLMVSGIRPVIDFGQAMATGLLCIFILNFLLIPCLLMVLPIEGRGRVRPFSQTRFGEYMQMIAEVSMRRPFWIVSISAVISVFFISGLYRLTVENRFIDYFYEDTAIHQGMLTIDRQLGGTTSLDIVIAAPQPQVSASAENAPEERGVSPTFSGGYPVFEGVDSYLDETSEEHAAVSYWLTLEGREKLDKVVDFLDTQPEIGKVMSLDILFKILENANNASLSDIDVTLLFQSISPVVQSLLVSPYFSLDRDEVRISLRVLDSFPQLQRAELISRINSRMLDMGFSEDDFYIGGILLLYSNVLQSLFGSQIQTLGLVLVVVLGIFLVLFRSLVLAVFAIAPNLLSVLCVLGLLGLLRIPLDIMTITVASISIGIAVDNAIHYLVCFKRELADGADSAKAMKNCHKSVGRAICYTSMIIVAGFTIFLFSNFIPTLYFGLFTSASLLAALVGTLILLPSLLCLWKAPTLKGQTYMRRYMNDE